MMRSIVYVSITKRDVKSYLYTMHPENRRAPYVRARQRRCEEHGERAYQQQHMHTKASV
jgi:hypothetical protein